MKTSEANELVTIESFPSEIEAEVVKGRLKGAGIKSFISKDDCGGAEPPLQLTLGVDLKVRQIDFARASDILKSFGAPDLKSKELKPGENKSAIYSLSAWILFFCGSGLILMSFSMGKAFFVIGMLMFVSGILFGIKSRILKKKIESKLIK